MARIGIAGDFCNTSVLEGIEDGRKQARGKKVGMAEAKEGQEAKDIWEGEGFADDLGRELE